MHQLGICTQCSTITQDLKANDAMHAFLKSILAYPKKFSQKQARTLRAMARVFHDQQALLVILYFGLTFSCGTFLATLAIGFLSTSFPDSLQIGFEIIIVVYKEWMSVHTRLQNLLESRYKTVEVVGFFQNIHFWSKAECVSLMSKLTHSNR